MTEHDQIPDGDTEQTPLLGTPVTTQKPRRPAHRHMLSVASVASIASVNVPKAHNSNTILNIICAITFVASSSGGFSSIPLTRLVENVICHLHYDDLKSLDDPIEEELCKVPAIQAGVAYVFATVAVCDAVVGFLAAFPWGIAADRIGRRPVFALALLGSALGALWVMAVLYFNTIFAPELVALECVFLLIGGGNAVLVGILMSMVTDITPEDKRAAVYMRVHTFSLMGNLMSPALASAMMATTGPWVVMWISVACLLSSAIAILFVPETMQRKDNDLAEDDGPQQDKKGHLSHVLDRLKESFSILKSPSLVLLLISCIFIYPATSSLFQFMVQFVSKRYQIPIGSTGYIQSAFGAFQLLQAFVVLPWISGALMRDSTPKALRMRNEQERDLTLAKWASFIVISGFLILGAAPILWMFVLGLVILAFGTCASSLIRSLMSLYVDPAHRSRLFSLIGMVELVGAVYSPPMLANLFSLGMRLGGAWIGLPYFSVSCLAVFTFTSLFLVRLPKHGEYAPPPYEEERVPHDQSTQ